MSDASVANDVEVVQGFLAALEDLDIDAAVARLHPDVVYQNVPLPPARGVRAVGQQLRGLERFCSGFEARIHNIAADGGTVLTERTDALEKGRFRAEFWVCGTFEVRDGRIVLWRDHFDYLSLVVSLLKGAVRAVLRR